MEVTNFTIIPNVNATIPLRKTKHSPFPKTVISVGLPRSGTSVTAAILDSVGVPMDESKDGHFERTAFKQFDAKVMQDEIKSLMRNIKFGVPR